MSYLFPLPPLLPFPPILPGSRPAVPPPSAIRELACVAWRFCRDTTERRSRKNPRTVRAPAPISSRFFCLGPPLPLCAPNQNRHATHTKASRTVTATAKKQQVFLNKTTTLHVHHACLYISQPLLHDYDVKVPNLTFCRVHGNTRQQLSYAFPEL